MTLNSTWKPGLRSAGAIRVFHIALAALVVLGAAGPQRLRAQDAATPVGHVSQLAQLAAAPDDGIDATAPTMYQGILGVGDNPPVGGSTPSWPCVGGTNDPECPKIAAGGVVFAVPYQLVPVNANGQVYWTFSTTTASGTAKLNLTVTQGSTTILSYDFTETVTANGVWFAEVSGATLSKSTKGAVTVTATTTVGGKTITGKTTIHVQ